MYSKNVSVKYFKGTGEYYVVEDGIATLYPTLVEALREASAAFSREKIRYEGNPNSDELTR